MVIRHNLFDKPRTMMDFWTMFLRKSTPVGLMWVLKSKTKLKSDIIHNCGFLLRWVRNAQLGSMFLYLISFYQIPFLDKLVSQIGWVQSRQLSENVSTAVIFSPFLWYGLNMHSFMFLTILFFAGPLDFVLYWDDLMTCKAVFLPYSMSLFSCFSH